MIKFLDLLGIPGVLALFVGLIVGTIGLLRYVLKRNSEKALLASNNSDVLSKKSGLVDVNKYRGLIGNVGLMLSLGLVLSAFEFPDFGEQTLVDMGSLQVDLEEMMEIPPTEQQQPKPPKIQAPQIIEVEDEEIEEDIEVDLDMEADEDVIIEEVMVEEEPEKEEVAPAFFDIVEESAAPKGGMNAFYKYIKKNIKYPNQAKRMGVEGKVFVRFIIDTDGSITNVEVMKGIGAGCDEEAIRILQNAPNWNPGKQRGVPVRQRMVFPLSFVLGN